MKYRTVKIGEVIPRNAEAKDLFCYIGWKNYYYAIGEDRFDDETFLHFNHAIPEDQIRVPIEESEVVE